MFLEILTRTFPGRPYYLKRCQESLTHLRDPDWSQRIIMDEAGRGVEWANANMGTIQADGDWIWVLDDDDVCCYYDLIGDLKALVRKTKPDIVIVRSYHAQWNMLPPYERWLQRPIMGQIGPSCVVVRRDVWNAFHHAWTPTYAGDFWYINTLWDAKLKIAWLPITAAYQTQQSRGQGDPINAS